MNEQTTPAFSMRAGVILALAYVAMGKVGLMLAIEPGYASGIFPPAGLAVAAAYLWGSRTLPWIILGSVMLNLSAATSPLQTSGAMAALCIALASALQAWIGRAVLHRTIGPQTGLETIQHIGGYLLAAPFICLVGASLSVASLVILSIMPSDQILVAWMTWSLGDILGIVSIFPIMLALFGTPDSVWKGRRLIVSSVMAAVLILVGLAYVSVRQIESAKTTQSFQFQANRLTKTIQDHFSEQEFILRQLDVALSMSQREPITRETFRALVQPTLSRFPMLQAIEWVPEIPSDRRAQFEAAQKLSLPEFLITQRDGTGAIVPVLERPSYYPVTYIEPLQGNRKALGFDLGSNPSRHAAILRAQETESSIATEPVTLIQEEETQQGILLIQRVHTGANSPGLVLTVLRVEEFIGALLPERETMSVSVEDTDRGTIIYGTIPSSARQPVLTHSLQFGGRHYQLSMSPSPTSIATFSGWQSWSLLVGGVITDGLLGATILLITGTTNRVRMQVNERTQELAMKSDLLQAVIDTVPVRVFWKDQALRYLGCNPAFARDAGLSDPGELLGKTDYDLVWANEAGRYQADDMTVITSESPKIAFDEPQTTPSGHTAWLRTSKVPLKDRDNQVVGVLGMYEDITAQRTTETRLRESEERFALAMQAASDGLWDWNIRSQSTYLSPHWKSMLGYADHELDNSFATWERLVEEDGRLWTMALIHDCLSGKSNGFKTEFRMRHKDGHWIDILSRAVIVRDQNGEPLRMVGTHVDITERNSFARLLEQAKQTMEQQNQALATAHTQALAATEAKSTFLASMSHEIRTPLNAIIGMTEVLKEGELNPEQAGHVARLSRAADHLIDLVNAILDLSRIEAGQLRLEQISFNLRELLATVHDLMALSARTKQLLLNIQIRPDVPSTVIGDPTRLRQILVNLLGNAIKFTEQGEVVLAVEAAPADQVRFVVSDTGIGIDSEKLPSIFDSFTQGDTSITRKFGGSGLGLSICHHLVDIMGGQLTVTSTLGQGSTFEFTLPLATVALEMNDLSASSRPRNDDPSPAQSTRPLRILVADDLEDNRDLVALYLRNSPHTLEMAENGLMALNKFQSTTFDLVLMDIQMPVMDGLQATAAIREWERTHRQTPVPILALTAHALKEEADKSFVAGCTAHLTKPIKKQVLLRAIAEYVAPRTKEAA